MTQSITETQNQESFRVMMRGFPTGVAVVTTVGDDGRPWGMTCSSVCSVTLDPPTLLVCLRDGSPTLSAMRDSGQFAVNLLHGQGQPAAELFASGRLDRFDVAHWEDGPAHAGPHLTMDAHAIADCDVIGTQPVGDHVVVFGQARRIRAHHGHPPLLYGRQRYHIWPES